MAAFQALNEALVVGTLGRPLGNAAHREINAVRPAILRSAAIDRWACGGLRGIIRSMYSCRIRAVKQSSPICGAGEADMGDKSITKVTSKHSPKGPMGQKYLASGVHVSMRLWEREQPGEPKPMTQRAYETVGYVIEGRAELHLEGQKVLLEPGDSWVVPKGSAHTYNILEPFTAVEATYPPAQVHGRDET
jgi:quercetin dioxygenase-like cupin family protein